MVRSRSGRRQGGGLVTAADGPPGGAQRGGEGDPVGVEPGAGGGAHADGRLAIVYGQVSPQFRAVQVRAAAAQDPAGAAQVGFALAGPGSIALRGVDGRQAGRTGSPASP